MKTPTQENIAIRIQDALHIHCERDSGNEALKTIDMRAHFYKQYLGHLMDTGEIFHDEAAKQFRLTIPEGDAAVDYVMQQGTILLVHSEVPVELRGQGIGKQLVEKTFEHILARGKHAKAVCPYIKAIARLNDKWKEIG